ncbi:MAG: c-type cytochrome [Marinobacter sp.]|uniref:c-type cytochrome n=1 Tax=Marinobacter sp. TaxID=50741 RepID=UPI003F97957F
MNEHDQRAQFREAPEPEEGTRTTPKIVLAYIAILIVWGVGYYAWQIGKPLQGGDSRTPVAAEHQQSQPANVAGSDSSEASEGAGTPADEASGADGSSKPDATTSKGSDTAETADAGEAPDTASAENSGADANSTAKADGEALFGAHCSSCHQANGQGVPGAFPPLAGSKWLQADPNIPIAIVHDGLEGEIEVAGNTFQGMMPPLGGQLSNAEIAAVLSYARSEWGNDASEVSPDTVAKHKERFGSRGSWSADELTEVFGEH